MITAILSQLSRKKARILYWQSYTTKNKPLIGYFNRLMSKQHTLRSSRLNKQKQNKHKRGRKGFLVTWTRSVSWTIWILLKVQGTALFFHDFTEASLSHVPFYTRGSPHLHLPFSNLLWDCIEFWQFIFQLRNHRIEAENSYCGDSAWKRKKKRQESL